MGTISNAKGQRKGKLCHFYWCENIAPVLHGRKIFLYELQAFQNQVLKRELGYKSHYVRLSEQCTYVGGRAVQSVGVQRVIALRHERSSIVFVECSVGSGLYDELVTRSEESYRMCV